MEVSCYALKVKPCHEHILDTEEPKIPEKPPKASFQHNIFTLPRGIPLNQPQVRPSILGPVERSLSNFSSRSTVQRVYSTNVGNTECLSSSVEDSETAALQDLFTTTFRKMNNRNRFAQRVFFLLGLVMCFSFVVYFLIVTQERVMNEFRSIWMVLLIFFACVASLITLFMFACTRSMRKSPTSSVILIFLMVSVTIQFGALGARFVCHKVLMYISGSLMLIFFVGSILSSQKKCEATGVGMFVFFIIIATIISIGMVALLTLIVIGTPFWELMGIAVIIALIATIFVVFLIRDTIHKQELKATDYTYAALRIYASLTTLYGIQSLVVCLRKSKLTREDSLETSPNVVSPSPSPLQ